MDLLEQWKKKAKYKVCKDTGCWLYAGKDSGKGYIDRKFKVDGKRKSIALHRLSYILFVGVIPKGNFVTHNCYNKRCINPVHLKASTHKEFANDILNREKYKIYKWRPRQKLFIKQIQEIKDSDLNSYKLAEIYLVSPMHIRRIKSGSRCSGIK